ncbi:DNA-3-methyladenine glycosylase [Candidatus Uhrbacteria bacterium]|nr:DNA-3-methyladenine glycosylase [Candidatus Uhrbacteria bacterium]
MARDLLGCRIVRIDGALVRRGIIVEVEIYPGPHDRASHAFGFKKTQRNAAEYMQGGHAYIYCVYGMYWQLNISTGAKGYPSCVLIRAIDAGDTDIHRTNGPGKLCRWLGIDKNQYGLDLTVSSNLWIEERCRGRRSIRSTPRIGIDYAGREWAQKPLRLYLAEYEKQLPKLKSKYNTSIDP